MRYTTKRSGGPECEVGNVLCAEKLAPCMSEMGQTRPICDVRVTSAIPPIADARRQAGQASHRVRR